MRVSVHKQRQSPKRRRQQASRYRALVEAVSDVGLDQIYDIELWARAGYGAGKFAYIDVAIRFLGAKGSEQDLDLQTAEDVVECLFESALEYEDENGPHTFQAVLFEREKDGGRASDPVAKRSFRTTDDPACDPSEREDANAESLASLSKTMGAFQKTTSAVLKELRETATLAREFQPSAESVAATANAKVELAKLSYEHEYDDKLFTMIDKRLEQFIAEVAPGLREAMATEPTKNTLPERLREVFSELSDEQREQLEDLLGEDMWKVLVAAKETETNVDCRSVLESFQILWAELSNTAKEHMTQELFRILGDRSFQKLVKAMRAGGVL